MCDVTRPETLESLHTRWLPEIARYHTGHKPKFLLIGNKSDLEQKVSRRDLRAFAKQHAIEQYMMSSAATLSWATYATPIESFFIQLVGEVLMRRPQAAAPGDTIRLYHDDDDKISELKHNCVICE
jgi:hypothetical protein